MKQTKIYQVLLVVAVMAIAFLIGKDYRPAAPATTNSEANVIKANSDQNVAKLAEQVLPQAGVTLPVTWGDLGVKLVQAGVIDEEKFKALYDERGSITAGDWQLLTDPQSGRLKITNENAGFLLNLLWALGLANKNPILKSGPMVDQRYGGAGNFASTGGWTMARGQVMDHYGHHQFITLALGQQQLVETVAKKIYRPCCNNSTYFPDCNHGMAMLGLLELMASQGATERQMYQTALVVNAYWFPDTYLTLAKYLQTKNIAWSAAKPEELLGADYSSASGYRKILSTVNPEPTKDGGGCGV